MHSAAIFKIANQRNVGTVNQLAQPGEFALHGIQVEQSLARVFTRPVATIDHRNVGGARKFGDSALLRMPHHDGVGVAAHHAAGVIN